VYRGSELLKVKVPVIFLGTVGFSLRRDGRYVKDYAKVEVYFNSISVLCLA
jgi:hypothetical protein